MGLITAVVALFMVPMSLREACTSVNRRDYILDELQLEHFSEGSGADSSVSLEGRLVSTGERYVTDYVSIVGLGRLRELSRENRVEGYRVPVRYLPKQGGFAALESPDGKFVYYTALKAPGIWRVAGEGGEEAPVLDHPKLGYWDCWGVVNEGIYYINLEVKQHPVIEFFSFATGRVRQIATMEKEAVYGAPGFAISPDGRWILYAQVDQSGGDITLVENYR